MRKIMLVLTAVALATPFSAQPAAAQKCTNGYADCLNETYDTEGGLRVLADVECFVDYMKCVMAE
ncbi:MAG TPA: hypothetical protein VK966_03565 [Longimicrobiales bacterium]|nr:hypothetical protein [Longimicrobiales bacterium]